MNFPATAANLSVEQQNSSLGGKTPRSSVPITSVLGNRNEIDLLMKTKDLENHFTENAILEPFHLLEMVKSCHMGSFGWTLLLDTSQLRKGSEFEPLVEMVKRKFSKAFPAPSSNDANLLNSRVIDEGNKYSFCVKEGTRGTGAPSGIMFLFFQDVESFAEARARLDSLLAPLISVPPLLVLTSAASEETSHGLGLREKLSSGKVVSYDIIKVTPSLFDIDQLVRITEGVKGLVKNAPKDLTPGYSNLRARDLVENFVVDKVFSNFFVNAAERRKENLVHRSAEDLIELYNSAIDHIVSVLSDPALLELQFPAASDSSPHNPDISQSLIPVIERLKLPAFTVHDSGSWKNIVDQVFRLIVYFNLYQNILHLDSRLL